MMMKFTCNTGELNQGINSALLAVSPKSTLLALEGILVRVTTKEITLMSYNLEMGITAIVDAKVEKTGEIIIPAKVFSDIIRRIESDEVTIEADDRCLVQITGGVSQFTILGMTSEEFPELPTVEYQNSLILPQSRLKAMISQTLFAVSDNESRPIHTGSLFEVDSEGLTIVSVDGYRLALRHESIDKKEGAETFSFVVPGAALSEVEKICSDVDEPASVTQGARHVMFKVGDTMLVSRRLEGEFLAYRNAIPRNNTIQVVGETRKLLASIDRVSLIISDKLKSPLRCIFGDNVLSITTKTGIGDAADQCPIEGDGGGLEIGFNNRYLMDALKAAPAEKVRLELTSGVAPCVILPAEGEENFLYMVLPVRLKASE